MWQRRRDRQVGMRTGRPKQRRLLRRPPSLHPVQLLALVLPILTMSLLGGPLLLQSARWSGASCIHLFSSFIHSSLRFTVIVTGGPGRLATWHLPGGPVGLASRWATTSNVEVGQTTYPVSRGRAGTERREESEGQSHKKRSRGKGKWNGGSLSYRYCWLFLYICAGHGHCHVLSYSHDTNVTKSTGQ